MPGACLVAIFAIFGAPLLKDRFGTARALYGNVVLLALTLLVIGLFPGNLTVVIVAVIISGIFSGVNNTLVTTAVMSIAPVERPVASATYGFVRFIGGGLAPFAAGKLVERFNEHVPFILATITAIVAAVVLSSVHQALERADRGEVAQPEPPRRSTGSSASRRPACRPAWATRSDNLVGPSLGSGGLTLPVRSA